MSCKYYLKQVERKTGKVSVVGSYEDYSEAIEDMEALRTKKKKNREDYGYYITLEW